MPSDASRQFDGLMAFVDQLVAIHGRLQQGKGRRHSQDALHRAGVVLTVAAWESYIESVVLEALNVIESEAFDTHAVLPPPPVSPWARHAFFLYRTQIETKVKRFHTPDATGVRDLLQESLACNIWPSWHWTARRRHWNSEEMRKRLNAWLRIRHAVAHGSPLPSDIEWIESARGDPRLTLSLLRECKAFFSRVVNQTDGAVAAHLIQHHRLTAAW
jgi:hypothetical protein